MNSNFRFSNLAGLVFGAVLAVPLAAQAQTSQQVKVGGTVVCSGDLTMQVDPAGNLNFPNCTASSSGGTPTAPVCSNSAISVNADATATPTITANCANGGAAITGYAWTAGTGSPALGNATTTVSTNTAGPFPTAGAGPFTYTVTATNSVGTSAAATITVSVVAPGVCGAAAATATWGSTIYNTATPSILKGSYVSYKLPLFPTAGKIVQFHGVNNNAVIGNAVTEFVVGSCPGDFNNACKVAADPLNGALNLSAITVATASPSACRLVTGQQYYLNVRNTDTGGTNTCPYNNCSLIITMSGTK